MAQEGPIQPDEGETETVGFMLDGKNYEVELSRSDAERLRAVLAEYVAHARRVGRRTGTAGRRTQDGPSAGVVRAWARSQGYDVPGFGRIPTEIRSAFVAAHL